MSHHIYHTEGLIVAQKPKGESDVLVKIFTPDFGMLVATAQGARKLGSKTRFALVQYSIPQVDIIKTKESFRVGAVRPEATLPTKAEKLLRAKVSALLARFVIAAEPHPELYEKINKIFKSPNKNSDIVAMVTLLDCLGYWHSSDADKEFLQTGEINSADKKQLLARIDEVVSHIHL